MRMSTIENEQIAVPAGRLRSHWWPILAFTLVALQAGVLPFLRTGGSLNTYTTVLNIAQFLVLLLTAGLAIFNAFRSAQAIRLFWSLFASGCGMWAANAGSWAYSLTKGKDHPDFVMTGLPLYLHVVFLIAAVASRPHLKLVRDRPYRTTLNLLVMLFVCVFSYAFVLIPISSMQFDSAHLLHGQVLYLAENLLLLAALGTVIAGASPPWKTIYWHLLGASTVYIFGSQAANLALAQGRFSAGLHDLPYMIATYWFTWVALLGRDLAPQLAHTVQTDPINPKYASTLATMAVIAIPILGMWELFRPDQPYATRAIRLFIVLLAVLFLAVTAFTVEYFAKRELSSDVGIAHERLRMAMAHGKSVGWDRDLKTGRDLWSGDLRGIFGIGSDTFSGQSEDFDHYVHEDDRHRVSAAVADAQASHKPFEAEFRVVRQDGTICWIAANGTFYYGKNGEPQRMLGMAMDITERKLSEEALASLSGRLIDAQEEERKRIAREIHDDYNQRLALIAISLANLAENIGNSTAEARLRQLRNHAAGLSADLHSLSHRLHSSKLETLGLVAAVKAFCREFADQQGIQVDFVHENVPPDIPGDAALCLFRIAQEGLRNIKRHSGASKAEVLLEWQGEKLHLSVADQGRGFDPKKRSTRAGIGIESMKERLRLLGGQLEVHSRPMEGTRIDAWLPVKAADQRADSNCA
jgi:PAS domain S-box-containing protein